ncbi:putative lipoprotein [Synechococcus sp. BIOS-E4-1]|nr:putative lipoprotein [Synechococcus sp. BIOS-E4-1]
MYPASAAAFTAFSGVVALVIACHNSGLLLRATISSSIAAIAREGMGLFSSHSNGLLQCL